MRARRLVPWREAAAQLERDVARAPGALLALAGYADAVSTACGHREPQPTNLGPRDTTIGASLRIDSELPT